MKAYRALVDAIPKDERYARQDCDVTHEQCICPKGNPSKGARREAIFVSARQVYARVLSFFIGGKVLRLYGSSRKALANAEADLLKAHTAIAIIDRPIGYGQAEFNAA